jgi:hypothetical protein
VAATLRALPAQQQSLGRRRRLLLGIAGTTAAIGVGLLATGIYYGVHGAQLSDDAAHAAAWTDQLDREVRVDGPAANRNLEITVAIGSVAVATAAALAVVALRHGSPGTVRAALQSAPSAIGGWSF